MKWVGITGSIGTGKSTVSTIIRNLGYPVLDADKIAQEQLKKNSVGYEEIIKIFGSGILDSENEIDRKKLSAKVFGNPEILKKLENIVHPLVQKEVEGQKAKLVQQGNRVAFYDVPLLFEKKLQDRFDEIILVACDPQKQLERIRKRNKWSDEEIQKRIQSQIPLGDKIKMSRHIIYNNFDLETLQKNTTNLVNEILAD